SGRRVLLLEIGDRLHENGPHRAEARHLESRGAAGARLTGGSRQRQRQDGDDKRKKSEMTHDVLLLFAFARHRTSLYRAGKLFCVSVHISLCLAAAFGLLDRSPCALLSAAGRVLRVLLEGPAEAGPYR